MGRFSEPLAAQFVDLDQAGIVGLGGIEVGIVGRQSKIVRGLPPNAGFDACAAAGHPPIGGAEQEGGGIEHADDLVVQPLAVGVVLVLAASAVSDASTRVAR